MIEDCNRVYFDSADLLKVERKHHYDDIYYVMEDLFNNAFRDGIANVELVNELKHQLKGCMSIDYDFAGAIIFEIMKHHSPDNIFQTVEPGPGTG